MQKRKKNSTSPAEETEDSVALEFLLDASDPAITDTTAGELNTISEIPYYHSRKKSPNFDLDHFSKALLLKLSSKFFTESPVDLVSTASRPRKKLKMSDLVWILEKNEKNGFICVIPGCSFSCKVVDRFKVHLDTFVHNLKSVCKALDEKVSYPTLDATLKHLVSEELLPISFKFKLSIANELVSSSILLGEKPKSKPKTIAPITENITLNTLSVGDKVIELSPFVSIANPLLNTILEAFIEKILVPITPEIYQLHAPSTKFENNNLLNSKLFIPKFEEDIYYCPFPGCNYSTINLSNSPNVREKNFRKHCRVVAHSVKDLISFLFPGDEEYVFQNDISPILVSSLMKDLLVAEENIASLFPFKFPNLKHALPTSLGLVGTFFLVGLESTPIFEPPAVKKGKVVKKPSPQASPIADHEVDKLVETDVVLNTPVPSAFTETPLYIRLKDEFFNQFTVEVSPELAELHCGSTKKKGYKGKKSLNAEELQSSTPTMDDNEATTKKAEKLPERVLIPRFEDDVYHCFFPGCNYSTKGVSSSLREKHFKKHIRSLHDIRPIISKLFPGNEEYTFPGDEEPTLMSLEYKNLLDEEFDASNYPLKLPSLKHALETSPGFVGTFLQVGFFEFEEDVFENQLQTAKISIPLYEKIFNQFVIEIMSLNTEEIRQIHNAPTNFTNLETSNPNLRVLAPKFENDIYYCPFPECNYSTINLSHSTNVREKSLRKHLRQTPHSIKSLIVHLFPGLELFTFKNDKTPCLVSSEIKPLLEKHFEKDDLPPFKMPSIKHVLPTSPGYVNMYLLVGHGDTPIFVPPIAKKSILNLNSTKKQVLLSKDIKKEPFVFEAAPAGGGRSAPFGKLLIPSGRPKTGTKGDYNYFPHEWFLLGGEEDGIEVIRVTYDGIRNVVDDFEFLEESDAAEYLPILEDVKVSTTYRKKGTPTKTESLFIPKLSATHFENAQKGSIILNTGLQVRAIAWVPGIESSEAQYIAVGGFQQLTDRHSVGVIQTAIDEDDSSMKGCIQIWKIGKECEAKLEVCFLHENGFVSDLQWMPYGGFEGGGEVAENQVLRLGILAATFGDGSFGLYNIPQPGDLREKVMGYDDDDAVLYARLKNPIARANLKNGVMLNKVTWVGHKFVAIGCTDGSISVWSLERAINESANKIPQRVENTSAMVDEGERVFELIYFPITELEPDLAFPAHMTTVSSIDCFEQDDQDRLNRARQKKISKKKVDYTAIPETPYYICSSAIDGTSKMIDLRDPIATPTLIVSSSDIIFNCSWLPLHGGITVALENSNRVYCPFQVPPLNTSDLVSTCMAYQTAPIITTDASKYLPFIASAGEDGECEVSNLNVVYKSKRVAHACSVYKLSFDKETGVYDFDESLPLKRVWMADSSVGFNVNLDRVSIRKVTWNPNRSCASLIASGTSAGLVRIDDTFHIDDDSV